MDSGSAKREAAPRPGRDNSVSSCRHNLLTASFWIPNDCEPESVRGNKHCIFNGLNRITASDPQPFLLHRVATTIPRPAAGGPSVTVERLFLGSSTVPQLFLGFFGPRGLTPGLKAFSAANGWSSGSAASITGSKTASGLRG